MARHLTFAVALWALAPLALGGCPSKPGCAVTHLERTATLTTTARTVAVYLERERYYSVQRRTLPAFGPVADETGGGLRRLGLTIDTSEPLAAVLEPMSACTARWDYDLDCTAFTRADLDGAPGATLSGGGTLLGTVTGHGALVLTAPLPAGRLTLVRLERDGIGGAAPLELRVTAHFEFHAATEYCHTVALGPPPSRCGNGLLEGDEACDDGNTRGGDGCSATCTLEAPLCTPDGGLWLNRCEAGEPTRCVSRRCAPGDPDPGCHSTMPVTTRTFLNGRWAPREATAGRVASRPAGLDCTCAQDVVGADTGRGCAPGCTAELPACTTSLRVEVAAPATLASWWGACGGTGECRAPNLYPAPVAAVFATGRDGVAHARALIAAGPQTYAPQPSVLAAAADGTALVALAFAPPLSFAGQTLEADGPALMVARVGDAGAPLWLRRMSVPPTGGLAVHALTADADGGAILAGSVAGALLIGPGLELRAEAGGRTLFVARFAPDGTPRWATLIDPGVTHWVAAASVAVDGDTVAVAATVTPLGHAHADLALAALDAGSGAVRWTRLALAGADLADVAARGVDLLPGGEVIVAGMHAADRDGGGLLPPRAGEGFAHFVARLTPAGAPLWTRALGETADAAAPSACAADRVGDGAYHLLATAEGRRLARLAGDGTVTWRLPVTEELPGDAALLGADPLTGDALLAGNGVQRVGQVDYAELWAARLTAGGDVVWSERHQAYGRDALRAVALAAETGGGAALLVTYGYSVAAFGLTLPGCDGSYNGCRNLGLVRLAP
ncbi:MAG TPA: myxococcus cysteine-rich repeat containing protein [Polyangia bacterium]|jgi:cysteine-rich repeat protein